jgi:hypothetical protein
MGNYFVYPRFNDLLALIKIIEDIFMQTLQMKDPSDGVM